MKVQQPPRSFVAGPTIQPGDLLLEWLEQTGGENRRLIRLPIVVSKDDGQLGYMKHAQIGGQPSTDGVRIKIDDTGMGMPIQMHLENRLDSETGWVAVWLDGYWGPLLKGPVIPGVASGHVFAVLSVGETVASDAVESLAVFVEG